MASCLPRPGVVCLRAQVNSTLGRRNKLLGVLTVRMNTGTSTSPSVTVLEEPPDPGVHPQLRAWRRSGEKLAFVYSRSMGGLIATGWAVVAKAEPKFLRLRTSDGHLLITIAGAAVSTEPQRFFSADLLRSDLVSGLSLQLASHDWLFLSSSVPPEALSLPSGGESAS